MSRTRYVSCLFMYIPGIIQQRSCVTLGLQQLGRQQQFFYLPYTATATLPRIGLVVTIALYDDGWAACGPSLASCRLEASCKAIPNVPHFARTRSRILHPTRCLLVLFCKYLFGSTWKMTGSTLVVRAWYIKYPIRASAYPEPVDCSF